MFLNKRRKLVLLVLLSVVGMGIFASGLAFVSISLYDRGQVTAPSGWSRVTGHICHVDKISGSSPVLFQASVCYRAKGSSYLVKDLTSPVKAVRGTSRTVLYDPQNPSHGRDVGQPKPNWPALLKEGSLLVLVGVVTLGYSIRKLLKIRGARA